METTRRVRHDVADAVVLMVFSLGVSVGMAVAIALLTGLR
jgi:hypothetical protein